ncbi:hypothetical protein [Streptacidiphilus sp. MAP12-16]|uniref:hypothetical protein n=1 Tax=Streptacidiphilus sp. MAP12-16 TaxID=3156300 RepID=UPI0035183953
MKYSGAFGRRDAMLDAIALVEAKRREPHNNPVGPAMTLVGEDLRLTLDALATIAVKAAAATGDPEAVFRSLRSATLEMEA